MSIVAVAVIPLASACFPDPAPVFHDCAAELSRLVDAIDRFGLDEDRIPATLDELAPYLSGADSYDTRWRYLAYPMYQLDGQAGDLECWEQFYRLDCVGDRFALVDALAAFRAAHPDDPYPSTFVALGPEFARYDRRFVMRTDGTPVFLGQGVCLNW